MKLIQYVLAAALLIASQFAFAAKPPGPQEMSSAPMPGRGFHCTVYNATDHAVSGTVVMLSAAFGGVVSADTLDELPIGRSIRIAYADSTLDDVVCWVQWQGQKGDLTATLCSYGDTGYVSGTGCLELY